MGRLGMARGAALVAAMLLAACGQAGTVTPATGGGGGAVTGGSPAPIDTHPGGMATGATPTPAPSLGGTTLRALPAVVDGQHDLVLSNADPSRSASYGLTLASSYQALAVEPDAHVARERAEIAALHGLKPGGQAYRLNQTAPAVGSTAPFYVLLDTDPTSNRETQVTAELLAVGAHCYVWVDQAALTADARATLQARASEIESTFDGSIYATDTRLFGSEPSPGIDGDARIHILVSPAINDYGANATLGYFSRRDEYAPQPNGPAILQHSNAKELINLTSDVVLTGTKEDYLGTIAHEFQHMINFNQKVIVGGNADGEDLWVDEGMAMYAMEANGYGLMGGGQTILGHVLAYQEHPSSYSLTDWDHNPQSIGYGPVYLFMVYLADRFGEAALHAIVTSKDVGVANVDARLKERGSQFTDAFSDWSAADLLDHQPGADAPRYSYRSIDLHGTYGGVTLPGFRTTTLRAGDVDVTLRPCTTAYANVGSGSNMLGLNLSRGVEVLPTFQP